MTAIEAQAAKKKPQATIKVLSPRQLEEEPSLLESNFPEYRDQNISSMTKMLGDGLGQTLYIGKPGFVSKEGYYSPFNTATREQKNALLASAIRV